MARIRSTKPEMWTDETLADCSIPARLLFVASLNFADDNGNLERSARQLKAKTLPYDSIDCEPLIQELLRTGLFVEYEVADKTYLHIKGFLKHQKIDHPSKTFIIPNYEDSLRTHEDECCTLEEGEAREECSRAFARTREDSLLIGVESSGVEGKGITTARKSAPGTVSPEQLLDFKLAYPNRAGDQGWRKAQRAAHARLAEGHTLTEMVAGAQRYAAYIRSTGSEGTQYVKQACVFLGPDKHFLHPWTPVSTKAETHRDANIENSQEWLNAS
jgi:hypothetical protein